MKYKVNSQILAKGVKLNSIYTKNFNSVIISISMILPLDSKTCSRNAILPFILCKSTKSYNNYLSMNKKLASLYGAKLSADVDKIGNSQVLTLTLRGINEDLTINQENIYSQYAEFLSEVLLNPNLIKNSKESLSFPQKNLDLSKQEVLDILCSQVNDKREYAKNKCIASMFETSPYALNPLGSEEKILATTSEEVKQSWDDCIKNSKIEIFTIGMDQTDKVSEIFKKAFSNLDRENIYEPKSFSYQLPEKIREFKENLDVSQTKLVLGFKVEPNLSSKEISAIKLMTIIYGGSTCSKLFENAREKLSLCYYCTAKYYKNNNYILLESGIDSQNIEIARAEFLKQLNEIRKGNISDEELKMSITWAKSIMDITNDSLECIGAFYLSQILENSFISTEEILEEISKLTKEDVINAANNVQLNTVYILDSNGTKGA